jgi:UDP-N-acetylglucosamine--N-acetylmuramyl-(pentapeptide) pyrophosphoryl-undecaprenol N-acetylglucosamine transferase
VPGLANKIIGRYAAAHATGMPTEFYPGSKTKLHYTGIPLTNHYQKVSFEQIKKYRKELGLPEQGRVVLVTGGSLGAERLNNAFAAVASTLLEQNKDLHILHQVGKGNLEVYSQELRDNPRLHAQEFMMDLYRYSGAADVIVTRGGANTLAELALQHKACIVIPNPELTGGHQTKNAEHLKQAGAVVVIIEKQLGKELNLLVAATQELLDNPKLRGELAHNLSQLAKPTAAYDLATILLSLRT